VLEPPSEALLQRLTEWQLATGRDIARAARLVKRLAHDLPVFDSVWIDALVQQRLLTPYQARELESESPQPLAVREWVLLDELGRGRWSRCWLARAARGRNQVVVKWSQWPEPQHSQRIAATQSLVATRLGLSHPGLISAEHSWHDEQGLWTVSPFVAGTSLAELLVRRGRVPATVLQELGRTLLQALARWHASGQVHGDIRLAHLRLTPRGHVVLVEAGLRGTWDPAVSVAALRTADRFDGIAPELGLPGSTFTPATDLYALGCVLWQLAAGRPPFLSADPLVKLAQHRSQTIGDVRDWAPETPTALAEALQALTASDPAQRPSSASDALRLWPAEHRWQGRSSSPASPILRRFFRTCDVTIPHFRSLPSRRSPAPAAIAMVLLIGAVIGLWTTGRLKGDLLSLAEWTRAGLRRSATSSVGNDQTTPIPDDRLPLPSPGSDGTIWLTTAGPYRPVAVQVTGQLTIRAAEGVCPELLIRDESLELVAAQVSLHGLRVRLERSNRYSPPSYLIAAQTQQLQITGCQFDGGWPPHQRANIDDVPAVTWRALDRSDLSTGQVQLKDCHFLGRLHGVHGRDRLRRVILDNVLWSQHGAGVLQSTDQAGPPLEIRARSVTSRQSGPLLQWGGVHTVSPMSVVVLTHRCVWEPVADCGLLEWVCPAEPAVTPDSIQWSADDTLLSSDSAFLGWRAAPDQPMQPLPTDNLLVDGLSIGAFRFRGLATDSFTQSVLEHVEGPRQTIERPGIREDRCPLCARPHEMAHRNATAALDNPIGSPLPVPQADVERSQADASLDSAAAQASSMSTTRRTPPRRSAAPASAKQLTPLRRRPVSPALDEGLSETSPEARAVGPAGPNARGTRDDRLTPDPRGTPDNAEDRDDSDAPDPSAAADFGPPLFVP
jgi:eukaryotic-like serine/threonine-protein kinase